MNESLFSFLRAVAHLPVGLLLVVLSLPWIAVAIGYATSGDDERYEAVLDRCPLIWWMDRRDV